MIVSAQSRMHVVFGYRLKQDGIVALMVSLGSQTIRLVKCFARVSIQNLTVLLTRLSDTTNRRDKSAMRRFSFSFIRVIKIWSSTGILHLGLANPNMQSTRVKNVSRGTPTYSFASVSVLINCDVMDSSSARSHWHSLCLTCLDFR